MKVYEAMTPAPASCAPHTPLRLVAQLMADHNCAAIPISDSGTLLGIITDRDIACRAVASALDAPERPAVDFMSVPVLTVAPDDPLEKAIDLMEENRLHHLPVIGPDGALVGMVAQSDVGRRMTNREFGELARNTSTPPAAGGHRIGVLVKAGAQR
jgi:CBS domain-containing protein